MSKVKENDFGHGSMSSIIIRQALPLTLSQLAALLYTIVDRIFIGHIKDVGFDCLTGIGLTLPFVTIINAFTCLFGQGGSPVFSIARGHGDGKKAGKVMHNSFLLLLSCAVVLTLLSQVFMKPLLYAFGAGDNSYGYAADYLRIYLCGTVFTMFATGMNYYISAQGFPQMAMITVFSGAAINMILDPIFIFALDMGIRGAAVATVISQAISASWVLVFLTGKRPAIRLHPWHIKPDRKICGSIIAIGFTGFIMEITNSISQIVCNRTLRQYGGEDYVGIMTIVNSVRAMLGVAVTGITMGAQPVLGYNYGARKYDRVRSGIVATSLFAFAYTLVVWILIILFPSFFIGLFSDDADLNKKAVTYLHIYFMAYVFMSLQYSGQSTFMALGMAKRAICFSIFRKIVLVVPLTLILPLFLRDSVSGVFWAEPVSNIIGGGASFLTMYLTVFRRLKGKKTELSEVSL